MNDNLSNRLSIIIPHYNNKDILYNCIHSLTNIAYKNCEIIVVDNNSTDNSVESVKESFPQIKIIKSDTNRGYAGGCNLGSKSSNAEFLLFLNNDTIHNNDFIEPLINLLDSDQAIASVQPKIINFDKTNFDYAGGSGGFMDYLVYPFARGRIFNTVEKDKGQYDDTKQIFWASGACFLTRKKVFENIGGFDETLFAHMEEIDFHWRSYMSGLNVYVEPKSIIYHKGGGTLNQNSSQKTYLNHRNSLILLLTNYSIPLSLYLLPAKLILEIISSLKELFTFKIINFINHYLAIFWVVFNFNIIISRRRKNKIIRSKTDKEIFNKGVILSKSIIILYFLLGRKKYSDLK